MSYLKILLPLNSCLLKFLLLIGVHSMPFITIVKTCLIEFLCPHADSYKPLAISS